MSFVIRLLLVGTGIALLGLGAGFFFAQPWAIQAWPWQDRSLSYAFIASMQAAIAAAVLWIAITGELGVIAAGALNLLVMMSGLAIYLGSQLVTTGELTFLWYTVACGLFALFNLFLFFWARRLPIRDPRPLPGVVRASYVLFILALAAVGTALVLQVPDVLPWVVEGPTSVVLGWMFLGDAFYFLYAILQPRWYGAAAQLWSFLAYDLVLIGPFLQRLPTIPDQYRDNLVVYVLILLYSGGLALYYLLLHRSTRILGA
ncbi:MAG: hypothetical protein KF832_16435 [Caldilineaceae bacterium]|nr:hypothetical protein [Caldilineaceae bacterium]